MLGRVREILARPPLFSSRLHTARHATHPGPSPPARRRASWGSPPFSEAYRVDHRPSITSPRRPILSGGQEAHEHVRWAMCNVYVGSESCHSPSRCTFIGSGRSVILLTRCFTYEAGRSQETTSAALKRQDQIKPSLLPLLCDHAARQPIGLGTFPPGAALVVDAAERCRCLCAACAKIAIV